MASIGGGGGSSERLDAAHRERIDGHLKIGNMTFSIPFGFDNEASITSYVHSKGYGVTRWESLGMGAVWIEVKLLDVRPSVKPTAVPRKAEKPTPPKPPKPSVKEYSKMEPLEKPKPKVDPATDLSWAKELDEPGLSKGLPDHLFDLHDVHPFKLWVNKMLYKFHKWRA